MDMCARAVDSLRAQAVECTRFRGGRILAISTEGAVSVAQ